MSNKSHLVGGFNPFEKYARQNGNLPQIGVNIKNIWNHFETTTQPSTFKQNRPPQPSHHVRNPAGWLHHPSNLGNKSSLEGGKMPCCEIQSGLEKGQNPSKREIKSFGLTMKGLTLPYYLDEDFMFFCTAKARWRSMLMAYIQRLLKNFQIPKLWEFPPWTYGRVAHGCRLMPLFQLHCNVPLTLIWNVDAETPLTWKDLKLVRENSYLLGLL